jgi:hypothetical protein
MYKIILTPAEGTNSSEFSINSRFIPSSESVLFDITTDNNTECFNVDVDSAKRLRDVLNIVIKDAEFFENKKKSEIKATDSTTVTLNNVTYVLPNFIAHEDASERFLLRNANIVIGSNGKIVKNRYNALG